MYECHVYLRYSNFLKDRSDKINYFLYLFQVWVPVQLYSPGCIFIQAVRITVNCYTSSTTCLLYLVSILFPSFSQNPSNYCFPFLPRSSPVTKHDLFWIVAMLDSWLLSLTNVVHVILLVVFPTRVVSSFALAFGTTPDSTFSTLFLKKETHKKTKIKTKHVSTVFSIVPTKPTKHCTYSFISVFCLSSSFLFFASPYIFILLAISLSSNK